jgi:hypothetical protein
VSVGRQEHISTVLCMVRPMDWSPSATCGTVGMASDLLIVDSVIARVVTERIRRRRGG